MKNYDKNEKKLLYNIQSAVDTESLQTKLV